MNRKRIASTILLASISAALMVTVWIAAPLPLLLLRRNFGRLPLFLGSVIGGLLILASGSSELFAIYLSCVLLASVYSECENARVGYSGSVLVTLLSLIGVLTCVLGFGIQKLAWHPVSYLRQELTTLTKIVTPTIVDVNPLLIIVPSCLIILMGVVIWLNSILVSRLESLLNWTPKFLNHTFSKIELMEWRIPDGFVWIALLSVAGSYFEVQPVWLKWVALNSLYLVTCLYFFQGLAVLVSFLERKQVPAPRKSLFFVLMLFAIQFTGPFLTALGFIDYWMEFRNRVKPDKSAVA